MKYGILPRITAERVEQLLRVFPVVVVTGARQTGKTTLVRHLANHEGRVYRTLDDPASLEPAIRDPEAFLSDAPQLTIDEVQRLPELLSAIKRVVDAGRSPGRFLLTGSANLLLMARVSESLAGRATYLPLRPLTESEKTGGPRSGPWSGLLAAPDAAAARGIIDRPALSGWSWTQAVVEGGFPVPAREPDPTARSAWFDGYVATYVERDLRQLARIDALLDFRRLMRVAALRTGRLANRTEIARDAGLSHATAHRWLNLMEVSCLLSFVPPYSVSRTKRLIKMPKLYWEDTGLAAHLAGVAGEGDLRRHESAGALLENLVWHHLRCWADLAEPHAEVATWRSVSGEEVDFVIESGGRLLPIEVKASTTVRSGDLRHLESFLDEYSDRAPFGIVLCNGAEPRTITRRILSMPLSTALGA